MSRKSLEARVETLRGKTERLECTLAALRAGDGEAWAALQMLLENFKIERGLLNDDRAGGEATQPLSREP